MFMGSQAQLGVLAVTMLVLTLAMRWHVPVRPVSEGSSGKSS